MKKTALVKTKQKVTDPGKVKNWEDLQEWKKHQSEDEVLDYYFKKLNESATNKETDIEEESTAIIFDLIKDKPQFVKSVKNQLWESYEMRIQAAMLKLIKQNHRMPSIMEINLETGISRKTIYQHLKDEGECAEKRKEYQEQFRFQRSLALSALFRIGVQYNDPKALKYYLEFTGGLEFPLNENNSIIQNQQNYVQVNGYFLAESVINELPKKIKSQLEKIVSDKGLKPFLVNNTTNPNLKIIET